MCTCPASRNGFGFSLEETDRRASLLESKLLFLPDGRKTHEAWRTIVVEYAVAGVQVHDARLVAAMRVHRIENLLTLNVDDFRRYPEIGVLHPEDILVL